ncbi:hypothetical protein QT231_23740 [Halomonas sp. SpR1]|uniref:DUF7709 family protein n=1 Tax=Halomonas sp. SpR1 TaxID=3050462 RepID=UPI0027E44F8B|nr:hypothetical protein [Halomonas sp. SpR1]MDQ7735715.1 hypothetical protein [Halomonas sp. SpR1]
MNKHVENTEQLAEVNKKIVSADEVLPSVQLKDGSRVQTGTVAANIHLYNSGERGQVEMELKLAIPTLVKIGLFDLFSPEEWINGSNPGRRFLGECAREFLHA